MDLGLSQGDKMSELELFGTVISHLPKEVDLRCIQAHVRIRSSPNSSWGETYLILHKGELILLTRSSVFDGYEVVDLSRDGEPRLVKGSTQSDLYLLGDKGDEYRLPVSPTEMDAVERLLTSYTADNSTA